jgi:hypothetical protein
MAAQRPVFSRRLAALANATAIAAGTRFQNAKNARSCSPQSGVGYSAVLGGRTDTGLKRQDRITLPETASAHLGNRMRSDCDMLDQITPAHEAIRVHHLQLHLVNETAFHREAAQRTKLTGAERTARQRRQRGVRVEREIERHGGGARAAGELRAHPRSDLGVAINDARVCVGFGAYPLDECLDPDFSRGRDAQALHF